jgi:hypothetical protein
VSEEISEEAVEEGIAYTHEISSPGPPGQTITIFQLLFRKYWEISQLPSTS